MENGNAAHQAATRLGQIIEDQHEEIERRWLERVQHDVVKRPGVELTQLRDGMPDYLVELARVLRAGKPVVDADAGSAWATVARAHGITRVRIGFDISQLVREFVVLRRTIEEVVRECDPELIGRPLVLPEVLEAAITAAVQAYADARDYEARRSQAWNIGFITHELRHPLSAAVLTASLLQRQATPPQQPLLERLDRDLRRLTDLIDSVLLTEKLESGEVAVHPVEMTLAQLMEPIEALRETAEKKGLAYRVSFDPSVTVTLDASLTRSALQNLADNALKYTDHGEVEISVTNVGDDVVVDVRDTCRGLSHEELATIFEPFKRGQTEKSGTGLGLAIARRAVAAQGGSIRAESPGASGCRFSIRLPKEVRARPMESLP